jgi:ribokinase
MADTSPQFVTAGGMRVDYLVTSTKEAHCNLPGGNALYSAVGAAIWTKDERVGLWSRIGENYPEEPLEQLEDSPLIKSGLVPIPGNQDHRTFYAYREDGSRDDTDPAGHFAKIGADLPPELEDYVHSTPGQADLFTQDPLALEPADWPAVYNVPRAVHLAPMPLKSHLKISRFLHDLGVKLITVDPGERYMIPSMVPQIRQLLPLVSAFLPSDQEIRSLFGHEVSVAKAALTLSDWGAKIVLIKLGPAGVLIYDKTEHRNDILPPYHEPGDTRIVDVTGAGDAFCGGFMIVLANSGGDVQLAAQSGLASASMVIEGYGALYALGRSTGDVRRRRNKLVENTKRP